MNTQLLGLKRKLTYIAVASCFTVTPAFGNPTGGVVTHGGATFSVQGNTLTINNMPNSIINWQQFSIGTGEITRFIQQNGQSAVLNRVIGQDPSAILGQLLSNGRVFLINPNGVLFGAGSRVDVAGLVVSTLNMTDQDFINGKLKFAGVDNAGHIVNQGELTSATGGKIYLVAPKVDNSGIITSPQGEIILAAGHTVNLVDAANPEIQVSLTAPATEAVNIGQIVAQSGKVGLYASLISQKGIINADRAVRDVNGEIILKAGNTLNLEAGSVTSAQGGGQIKAFANMQDGQVNVAGKLDASAPVNGNGGFIETSAAHVNVSNTAKVTTLAANGKHGTWLIDPQDFTIGFGNIGTVTSGSPSGDISGATLSTALENGNVTILSQQGSTPGNGDVFVNDGVNWGADTTLTLTAVRNIDINANITASGATSGLNLNATNGIVNVNAATNSNSVTVSIGGDINVNARGMLVQGGSASASDASTLFESGNNITLTLGSGGLNVRGGSATGSSEMGSGMANAEIRAINDIDIHGSVTVTGGTANNRSDSASANALISADHNITLSGPVAVRGGVASAAESGSSVRASTNAQISANNSITINGTLAVAGGTATATQNSSSLASANANASVSGSDITINGAVSVTGGTATATASGNSSADAAANASIRSNNLNINTTGLVTVAGGRAAASTHTFETFPSAFASGTASMTANVDINITSGGLRVRGGRAIATQSSSSAFAVANAGLSAGNRIDVTTSGTVLLNTGTTTGNGSSSADAYIESRSAAPSARLIELTFTNLNCCGVLINGQPGDAIGAETIGKTGFFAGSSNLGLAAAIIDTALFAVPINNGGGIPTAIFNTNYFVNYLGSASPSPGLLLYVNGAVDPNGVGEPLWTFLGNSLKLWNDPKDELKKQECGTHV